MGKRLGELWKAGKREELKTAALNYLVKAVRGDPELGELTPGDLQFLMREAPREWIRSSGGILDPQGFPILLGQGLAFQSALDMSRALAIPGNNQQAIESAASLAWAAVLVIQGHKAEPDPAALNKLVALQSMDVTALFGAALASASDATEVLIQTLNAMRQGDSTIARMAFVSGVFTYARGAVWAKLAPLMPDWLKFAMPPGVSAQEQAEFADRLRPHMTDLQFGALSPKLRAAVLNALLNNRDLRYVLPEEAWEVWGIDKAGR
jgi:hypothetical protein